MIGRLVIFLVLIAQSPQPVSNVTGVSHLGKCQKNAPIFMMATWYQIDGAKVAWHYHGRPGERMSPGCLTAAHRTLPFGTRLLVQSGGLSVEVVVTDRGPEAWTGVDIDLSRAAAERLGLVRRGRTQVSVVSIDEP